MKLHRSGGFWLCYAMNLLFHLEWTVPAWVLLVMHVVFDWPLWLFIAALAVWAAVLLGMTLFLSYVSACGSDIDRPKPNKNPYSAKETTVSDKRKEI